MIFRARRKPRDLRQTGNSRRRRLNSLLSRSPRVESLEQRNLLTAYLIDVATDNASDASGIADGSLSLREAIIASNTNAAFGDAPAGMADGDSITFEASLAGDTIVLGNGEYEITDDLTIDGSAGGGSRITLDGDDLNRIFSVDTTSASGSQDAVALSNLIVTNGNATGDNGGGIETSASPLSLDDVDITNSSASDGAGLNVSGGSVNISGGSISGNSAVAGGLGTGAGGGIHALLGSSVVVGSSANIDGNSAVRGGGVFVNSGSSVTLRGTSVDSNTASGSGGGLFVDDNATALVTGGTSIAGNSAALDGGGIANHGEITINSADIGTSALANTAGGDGGGLYLGDDSGSVNLSNADIAGNVASGAKGGGGIFLGSGVPLSIGSSVDILGNLADSDTGRGGGIFVDAGASITATGGTIGGNRASRSGGGIADNSGSGLGVVLSNVAIIDNTASNGDGGGLHIDGAGEVTISDSTISGNVSGGSGGGIGLDAGFLTIDGGLIRDNTARGTSDSEGGGGIFNDDGAISIVNLSIAGNTASSLGGGILNQGGVLSIDSSLIVNNSAIEGGGLWNSSNGEVGFTNTTLSTNQTTSGDGGGIFNDESGTISLDSVTITLNTASTGNGSGIAGGDGGVTITNTIVAQNPGGGTEQNLDGSIDSGDFNLIGDGEGSLDGDTINTLFDADALLLPLADNGGPTLTHLPAAGSPAIGFGSTELTVDQRGIERPQGSVDDIGAVEVELGGIVIDAGSGVGDGLADEFLIINDDQGITGNILVYVNTDLVGSFPKATTGQILIRGSSDDDTLKVDNTNGLIGATMIFDGDGVSQVPSEETPVTPGGLDSLVLFGETQADTTYNPGVTDDAGAVYQEAGEVVQRVQFFGLEPIQVLAPVAGNNILNLASAPLGVGFPQALNATNSINYTEGPNSNDPLDPVFAGALTGLITVDGFESLEFANFEVLNINAGAGSDQIHLNNPVTPNELATVNVDGGDPTASTDVVIVNGNAGGDAITIDQLSIDGARIVGAQGSEVNIVGAEELVLNGQGGNDDLTLVAESTDQVDFATGQYEDSGVFHVSSNAFGPTQRLIPISYQDLGAGGSVAVASTSGNRDLLLRVVSTDSAETFRVDNNGELRISKGQTGFLVSVPIATDGVSELFLDGRAGDDNFRIDGDHPLSQGIVIEGGSPGSGSDDLQFVGSGVGSVTLDLQNASIQELGFGEVEFAGIESIALDANADLSVDGTVGDDVFDVTPLDSSSAGTLAHEGTAASITYASATTLTINGSSGDGDRLNIYGRDVADVITSDADSVLVNGSDVTLGTGLESLHILAGGGDDSVDLSNLVFAGDLTTRGEAGDDTLIGSAQVDHQFGGSGNDILIGGIGDDVQYGESGNDIFGNPNLDADGTAQDPGSDQNFGGTGVDSFVWEPGDGTDRNVGGDDGGDEFRFFGREAADSMTLRSDDGGTQLHAIFNVATIVNSGIENVLVDPLGGNDVITIDDMNVTEVASVAIAAAGGDESITVLGRSTNDNLSIGTSAVGAVTVDGLRYDIDIAGASIADSLAVETGLGDDSVHVATGVADVITSSVDGGSGNDSLSGDFNNAAGGEGDDTIIGGDNDNVISGGAGEDTIVGGGGEDTIDGGADFDTILISGTSGNDVIDVLQTSATELTYTVNGVTETDTLVAETVEEAHIVAAAGDDLLRVNWADGLGVSETPDALRMSVDGGPGGTSDRLVVVDDATDDLVLYRKGAAAGEGSVTVGPGNQEPLRAVFSGIETVNFVDEAGDAINNDPAGPQLTVFKNDPFETNDDRFIATFLGGGATINVDPTIDPGALTDPFGDGFDLPGDRDFYRLVAATTGTLDFQVYFRQVSELASGRPGLPGDGDLDINVYDADGNLVSGFGTNDDTDDERVRIPAVAGQTYYLEVVGNSDAINVYNLSFVNEAPPVPYALELDDNPINGQTNPPGIQTDTSDTGRSQFDNRTYDNTPTIYFRLDDGIFLHDLPGNPSDGSPPDEVIPIPFQAGETQPDTAGYAIAIFDEGNTPPQTAEAPQTPLGFASLVPGQEGVYVFTVPDGMELSEGSHFLTARVQMIDPADTPQTGFGGRSVPLEIVVDRTPPEVVFGLASVIGDGLHPDSDTGDLFLPITLTDSITNDLTPTFFGRAEANSIVRAFLDLDDSGSLNFGDLLIGQTVATPYDGTEQLETPLNPDEPGGQWELTSTVNMNDPRIVDALGLDGVRRIFVTAEDVAGNISVADEDGEIIELFIDTQGPQVDGVFITDREDFNLFTLKPETPEPTPAVNSLTIRVIDLPERVEPFFYSALSNVPPLAPIVLVGDHGGVIAIDTLEYINVNDGPGVAVGEIVMTFSEPLPDDRYTLTLKDNIIDPAGNQLDGENNAAEPIGDPFFPTGDFIPGGDFIARFTVDSRPEVATWSQGVVYADINGNLVWDPEGQDNDATNRDFAFNFGEITDAYFTGNFAANAEPGPDNILGTFDDVALDPEETTSSGFDKLGAYGAFNGQYQFFLDTDDDGVGNLVGSMAFQVNAIPVAGNFFVSDADDDAVANGQRPRDEIGAFDGENWYLDVDGNNQIDDDERFPTELRGIPVVGDFNGDGMDDLATYNNDTGIFFFDLDRNGSVDDELFFGFSGFGERPVSGDVNLDGVDDLVMWVPRQNGQLPKEAGEFHFLLSDNVPLEPQPIDVNDPDLVPLVLPSDVFSEYSPAPLGNDLVAQFGDDFALPLLGNFDPPVVGGNTGVSFLGSLSNPLNPLDTTGDGRVTARDALVVINALGRANFDAHSNPLRAVASLGGFQLDASQDGAITALDALRVINGMAKAATLAEGESAASTSGDWASLADQAIADFDDDDVVDLIAGDSNRLF